MAARIKFSYETGEDGQARPYLWLNVGLAAGTTIKVRGLVDSGADVSVLPTELAQVLGLASEDLELITGRAPTGPVDVLRAKRDLHASLPGATERSISLRPIFVAGATDARWGRDFMALYPVAFDEAAHQFSLFSD